MKTSEMADVLAIAFMSSWPTFTLTEQVARLWAESFPCLDKETMWEVVKATLKTHTGNFPPTIGQVNATLTKMVSAREPTEGEMWGLLMTAVKGFGYTRPAAAREYLRLHGGEILVRAVRCMGWTEVCKWQTADEPANRAHFWKIYSGIKNGEDFETKVGRQAIEKIATPRVMDLANHVAKKLGAK